MVIKIDLRAALLLAVLFIPVLLLRGQGNNSQDVVTVCIKTSGAMRVVALAIACGDETVLRLAGVSGVLSGYEIVTASTASDAEDYKTLTVECPEGKVAISGGAGIFFASADDSNEVPHLISSFMYPDNNGWYAEGIQSESATTDWWLEVQVICITGGIVQ